MHTQHAFSLSEFEGYVLLPPQLDLETQFSDPNDLEWDKPIAN